MKSRKTSPTDGLMGLAFHGVLGFIRFGLSVFGAKLLMKLTNHQTLYFSVALPLKCFPKASAFGIVAFIVRGENLSQHPGVMRMHLEVAHGAEGVKTLDSILCDLPSPSNAIQRLFSWVDAFGGFTDFKGQYEDEQTRYNGGTNPQNNY